MDAPFPEGMLAHWERFFSNKEQISLDPKSGVCEAVFQDPLIFPLQRKEEMAQMLRIASSISPRIIFEVGSDKGGSVLNWCLLPTVQVAIAAEIRGLPYADLFAEAFPDIKFLWLPDSSHDPLTVQQVQHFLNGDRIDCLFLDGNKAAYLKDFDAYLPLMDPQGIVFLHDIQDSPGPKEAFAALKRRGYRTKPIIDTSDVKRAWKTMENTPHAHWLRWWNGRSSGLGVVYLGEKQ